jgi:hypothetical protein
MTWILVIYLSTGIADIATGGPAVIEGFSSQQTCEAANQQISKTLKKYDWGQCLPIIK